MFSNIPVELRSLRQWVLWRTEYKLDAQGEINYDKKPTKVPYQPWPGGHKASTTNPEQWGTFEQATGAPLGQVEPVHPNTPATSFSGIGFVFVAGGNITGIDLDDTHGDTDAFKVQQRINDNFASYAELSPSGKGLHIIVYGEVPHGKRRSTIEVYSSDRFFTMTGNTINGKPIVEAQAMLDILFEEMGGANVAPSLAEDKPQTESDETIIERARTALNGEKFSALFDGDFTKYYGPAHGHQGEGRSEADFALIDIVAYYTSNKEQVRRIFAMSDLGKAPKDNYAHRYLRLPYVNYMVEKAFDRKLPELDVQALTNLRLAMSAQFERQRLAAGVSMEPPAAAPVVQEPDGTATPSAPTDLAAAGTPVNTFPPGLLGDIAQFIYDAAPRPVHDIALAGAIAFLSGITGRAYNTYTGAGLNQYVLLLAPTGTGKDSISSGTSKLFNAVATQQPTANDFKGPGELVSSAGLLKWLNSKPCVFSILGEIGLLMQQMASPTANAHMKGLQRVLTQLYSKSGYGNTLDASAYSDQTKNNDHIHAPSFTMLGESVPGEFYASLDEGIIANGLLPRFLTFEYEGKRPYRQEGKEFVKPPISLVQQLSDIIAACLGLAHNGNVHVVAANAEAQEKLRQFDHWTTDQINESGNSEVLRHLWNRAHLKAIKLASIYAIGVNYLNPVVDMAATMWATNIVVDQTKKLIARFENDEVGDNNSSESKQVREVCKTIASYLHSPHKKYEKYGVGPGFHKPMHQAGIIPYCMVQRRLVATKAFMHDRRGASDAIRRAMQQLIDNDDIREMPKAQVVATFGTAAKCYMVANSSRFENLPVGD